MDGPRTLIDGPSGYRLMSIGHHGGGNTSGGGQDAGAGGGFGGGRRGQTRHERAMERFGGRGGDRRGERQRMYPGIRQGEKPREYRQRMENQRRQAAREAEQKAREEAARKAAEEAAARRAQQEQQRLAAIEEQRRRDAEEAARQRAAEEARRQAELQRAQALGTVVTTGPGSLNRPADPLPRYRGYTPMDYDVTKTGSLTDQYARMLNVPFFQPFIPQEDINLAPGATTADSIFGIESLMPTYTFDPATGLASDPYALQQTTPLRQGGRVQKDMGGFIGFMDEPLNIMHPTAKIDVVDDGISSILKKYKEIRSEL